MSHMHEAAPGSAGGARPIEQQQITDPAARAEIDAGDDHGRRWYHPRPHPRRRTDFMGFNSTWWMALGWLAVVIIVVI